MNKKKKRERRIMKIVDKPTIGSEKKGDLRGISMEEFKILSIQYLSTYRFANENLELSMIELHENHCRNLKTI